MQCRIRARAGRWWATARAGCAGAALSLLFAAPVAATDPERGARLFATPPAAGLLACADCHSEDPLVTNFGNIFVGRNAASLIQRAVVANTGGMGVFREFYDDTALADIAAYLGNSPRALDFGTQPLGSTGATQEVVVRASSKLPLERLALTVDGDFAMVSSDCAANLPARASCSVSLAFRPTAAGARHGVLRIDHSGLPTAARVVLTGQGLDRPPAQARVAPGSLSFAAPGASRQVLLINESPQPLTLGRISVSAPAFVLTGGTCVAGAVLAGGQSCAMALRWATADATGAVLTLLHDGVGGRSDVPLAGTAGAALTTLDVEPSALDFGVLEVNAKSALQAAWLHNRGPASLRLGAISTTRTEVLAAGGSCATGRRACARLWQRRRMDRRREFSENFKQPGGDDENPVLPDGAPAAVRHTADARSDHGGQPDDHPYHHGGRSHAGRRGPAC